MRGATLIVLISLSIAAGRAAFERQPFGALSSGMAGAGAALSGDIGMLWANPAAAALIPERSLAFSHSPSPFGVSELSRTGFLFAEPVSRGGFAIGGTAFGFGLYRELSIGFTFGGVFADGLMGGCTATYYRLQIAGYGRAAAAGLDLGLQWIPANGLSLGVSASNLTAPAIGSSRETLPQTLTAAVAFRPGGDIVLLLDLVKDIYYPLEARFGIDYRPIELLALRAGTSREPSVSSAGFGLMITPVVIDYAFTCHGELGFVHHLSLTFRLGGV